MAYRPALLDSGWLLRGEFTVLSCAGIPPSPVLYRTETATTSLHCMWGIQFFESLKGNTRPMTSQSVFVYEQPFSLPGGCYVEVSQDAPSTINYSLISLCSVKWAGEIYG